MLYLRDQDGRQVIAGPLICSNQVQFGQFGKAILYQEKAGWQVCDSMLAKFDVHKRCEIGRLARFYCFKGSWLVPVGLVIMYQG